MRRNAVWMMLLVCSACVAACGRNRPDGKPSDDPDSSASPANVFRKIKAAASKEDWAAFFTEFTSESQRRQLSAYLFLLEKQSEQSGKRCHRAFREFLAIRRIEPQPLSRNESDDDLKQRFTNVSSMPACLAAVIAWADKHTAELPKQDPLDLKGYRKLGDSTLRDAAIRGDRAILTVRLKEGRIVQFQLRQLGEEWRVDIYHK